MKRKTEKTDKIRAEIIKNMETKWTSGVSYLVYCAKDVSAATKIELKQIEKVIVEMLEEGLLELRGERYWLVGSGT